MTDGQTFPQSSRMTNMYTVYGAKNEGHNHRCSLESNDAVNEQEKSLWTEWREKAHAGATEGGNRC